MINFILLTYYEKYYEKSLNELFKLAESLNKEYRIIIVKNGEVCDKEGVISIKGNNSYYEFSGWDESLLYIRNNFDIKEDYFVFANDTFCFHRKWNSTLRNKFSNKFKKFMLLNIKGICGEVNTLNESYVINDQYNSEWVSTYLFMISRDYICDDSFCFNQIERYWDKFVLEVNKNGIVFLNTFDNTLSKHLNSWLFPRGSKLGWYNAKNATVIQKKKKLQCILNEKLLSSNVISSGGRIYSVNNGVVYFIKSKIRWLFKLMQIIKK